MKKLFVFLVVVVMVLLLSQKVSAQDGYDYITDVLNALENTNVYVDPSIDGPDKTITAKLQKIIANSSNIILVVLPDDAKENGDIHSIANEISRKKGDQYIIGISVGNEVLGYASSLPAGVAADQMKRADSVSNDPVTALFTFSQNMNSWLAKNPQPTPTVVYEDGKEPMRLTPLIMILLISGVSSMFYVLHILIRPKKPDNEKTNFKAPVQIKTLLGEISQSRVNIEDDEFKDILQTMCLDIERYFTHESEDKDRDAVSFKERLVDVLEVVQKYVEIQNNQRYFYESQEQMTKGKESVRDFSIHVLESIRQGNAAELLDYKVNSNILQAQRYK